MSELSEAEIWEELKRIFFELPPAPVRRKCCCCCQGYSIMQIRHMLKMRYLAEVREYPDVLEPPEQ